MNLPALFLINKPSGITSFQCLAPIKKRLGTKKIGHTGTLDKFAEGLMLVLVGQATRFAGYFTDFDKSYRAELNFGSETDTLDPHGRVISTCALPDRNQLFSSLRQFRGEIYQTPPGFSAIHINGKRAYQRVLAGEEFEIPSRRIQIYSLHLLNYDGFHASISIECSKGTYVRSLARDLARSAESCAYLTHLYRTSVGIFTSNDALDLEDFLALSDSEIMARRIWGSVFLQAVPQIQQIKIQDSIIPDIQNGKKLYVSDILDNLSDVSDNVSDVSDNTSDVSDNVAEVKSGLGALLDRSDEILAIIEFPEDPGNEYAQIKYHRVFSYA